MEESILQAMIKLNVTTYTLWKPQMENILNWKILFDLLQAKGKKRS